VTYLQAKRRLVLRVAVVLGVSLFVGLLLISLLSISSGGSHIQENAGSRFPGFWTDWDLLITLLIAAPFAAIAAWKTWKQ
jgi:hypothetical protein